MPRLKKQVLWRHGPRNVAWCLEWLFQNYFSEICLIIPLWNPLLGSFGIIKKDLCIRCGGLFSLSTHALTCLSKLKFCENEKITFLQVNKTMFFFSLQVMFRKDKNSFKIQAGVQYRVWSVWFCKLLPHYCSLMSCWAPTFPHGRTVFFTAQTTSQVSFDAFRSYVCSS